MHPGDPVSSGKMECQSKQEDQSCLDTLANQIVQQETEDTQNSPALCEIIPDTSLCPDPVLSLEMEVKGTDKAIKQPVHLATKFLTDGTEGECAADHRVDLASLGSPISADSSSGSLKHSEMKNPSPHLCEEDKSPPTTDTGSSCAIQSPQKLKGKGHTQNTRGIDGEVGLDPCAPSSNQADQEPSAQSGLEGQDTPSTWTGSPVKKLAGKGITKEFWKPHCDQISQQVSYVVLIEIQKPGVLPRLSRQMRGCV